MVTTKTSLIIFLTLMSFRTFALFGEETALMIQLVSTTVSQLNELERLVSNAEKYTRRLQQYNELMQDEYFKAERILYLAEELAAKKNIENLGDLNSAIRELKYSIAEIKDLMREYAQIKDDETKTKIAVKEKKRLNQMKMSRARRQVSSAITSRNAGRSAQLTAQNTALIHESQIEMQNDQLELMNKVSTTNRLLAEQVEDQRLRDLERRRSYRFAMEGLQK